MPGSEVSRWWEKLQLGLTRILQSVPGAKAGKPELLQRVDWKKTLLSELLPMENPGCELVSMEMLFLTSCADAVLKADFSKVARVLSEDASPSACLGA